MNVFRFWPRDTSSCSCCICRSRLEASAHRAALAQAATEEHQVISSGENRQRTIHFSCSSATAQALPEIFECSVLRLGHSHPLKSLKGWTAVPESSPSHIPSSLSLSLPTRCPLVIQVANLRSLQLGVEDCKVGHDKATLRGSARRVDDSHELGSASSSFPVPGFVPEARRHCARTSFAPVQMWQLSP